MPLTIEQLLQPRYRVIATYPKSIFKVGEIISGENIFCDPAGPKYADYSHLFEPVYWSKNRTAEEFPEYVVVKGREQIYKVHKTSLHEGFVCEIVCTDEKNTFVYCFLGHLERPATKEEYEAYKKK